MSFACRGPPPEEQPGFGSGECSPEAGPCSKNTYRLEFALMRPCIFYRKHSGLQMCFWAQSAFVVPTLVPPSAPSARPKPGHQSGICQYRLPEWQGPVAIAGHLQAPMITCAEGCAVRTSHRQTRVQALGQHIDIGSAIKHPTCRDRRVLALTP